jgi:hypothetical protein
MVENFLFWVFESRDSWVTVSRRPALLAGASPSPSALKKKSLCGRSLDVPARDSIYSAAGYAEDAEFEDPGTRAQHSGRRMPLQRSPRSFLSVPFGRTFTWCARSPPAYILRQMPDDECERGASVRIGAEDGARGFPLDPVCGCRPHRECICEQGGRRECSTEVETQSLSLLSGHVGSRAASGPRRTKTRSSDSSACFSCYRSAVSRCCRVWNAPRCPSALVFPFGSFELLCELNKQIISFLSSPWLRT